MKHIKQKIEARLERANSANFFFNLSPKELTKLGFKKEKGTWVYEFERNMFLRIIDGDEVWLEFGKNKGCDVDLTRVGFVVLEHTLNKTADSCVDNMLEHNNRASDKDVSECKKLVSNFKRSSMLKKKLIKKLEEIRDTMDSTSREKF